MGLLFTTSKELLCVAKKLVVKDAKMLVDKYFNLLDKISLVQTDFLLAIGFTASMLLPFFDWRTLYDLKITWQKEAARLFL